MQVAYVMLLIAIGFSAGYDLSDWLDENLPAKMQLLLIIITNLLLVFFMIFGIFYVFASFFDLPGVTK